MYNQGHDNEAFWIQVYGLTIFGDIVGLDFYAFNRFSFIEKRNFL